MREASSAGSPSSAGSAGSAGSVAVLELRTYRLRPGGFDVLAPLFDAHFVESQEEWGAHIVGQFADADDPDRFVWLRGFPDMATRLRALQGFYSGPVWQRHRDVANETMVDIGDVHLLRPHTVAPGFPILGGPRPDEPATGLVYVGIRPHEPEPLDGDVLASFTTLHEVNDFPALPVRDVDVDVWVARQPDAAPAARVLRLRPTPRSQLR